jgi:hypothetical protein
MVALVNAKHFTLGSATPFTGKVTCAMEAEYITNSRPNRKKNFPGGKKQYFLMCFWFLINSGTKVEFS